MYLDFNLKTIEPAELVDTAYAESGRLPNGTDLCKQDPRRL